MDFLLRLVGGGWLLPFAGVAVGVIVGYVARRFHFCTMSALERHWFAGDSNGLRSWILAAATALLCTQLFVALGLAETSDSFYLTEPLPVAGALLGGLLFGFGMALVGTCGFGALVRLGGGNLRALVVLTGIGLAALAAQRGVTGHFRQWFLDPLSIAFPGTGGQSLAAPFNALSGVDLSVPLGLTLGGVTILQLLRDRQFRADRGKLIAGSVIGLAIALGWLITSGLQTQLMRPVQVEAGSFVMPVGDAILQLIAVTGEIPDYGVGLVAGVFIGAAFAAWRADDMRWEACDDARELSRHLLGAFLMGSGGVFALGCTIGQGVSAVSVLAASAPMAVAAMVLGARIGLGVLLEGSPFGFLKAALSSRA
ncbi:YeeE/YedE family protein [Pseudohoeflea coraliihabitans]|uniref:YeeE/YedE family protein n=1 Tax=Pseudohoeflea coraliihabitans TaxID=2860393 RepID=A0ABS6WSI7_9HYPH|nr:YeeE/YedE family protein [Pseudohoeflea sp. DP4N28-3]MBW3098397.1 YeeE/YedE family protein [Pseudohoeflea sp. DP4N28-3]